MELMTSKEVAKYLRVTRDHYKKVVKKQAGFPKPFYISERKPMWDKSEIEQFLHDTRLRK